MKRKREIQRGKRAERKVVKGKAEGETEKCKKRGRETT